MIGVTDAWDAALGAALALVSRDLIGESPGWDQAAYDDLLTGPWRQVIGPIHPGDAPWDTTLRWREHDA